MQLIHGDCLDVIGTIENQSVDMVLVDPPYGTTACKWDNVIPFEPMWKELKRITKDNAAICLFGSEPFSSALRMSNIKMFKYDWYWLKNRGGFITAKIRPLNRVEIISVFSKQKTKYFPIFEQYEESTKKRFAKNGLKSSIKAITFQKANEINGVVETVHFTDLARGRYPVNFRKEKCPDPQNGARFHPTQKPVALLEYLIKTYTLEGETVLDFTMGSGSTGVACKNLNRNFIGIEKDEKYFEIAKQRILNNPRPAAEEK